jgi:UbiD family decarboxylase
VAGVTAPEPSIRSLMAALEAKRLVARVRRPVDPANELAAVALTAWRERGQTALFQDAGGGRAVSHLLADRARWEAALGAPPGGALAFVQRALRHGVPPAFGASGGFERRAPALERLPIPRAAAADATSQMAAVAVALDPATGRVFLGLTRHTVLGPGRLSVMDLCPTLEALRQRWRAAGQAMPIALALGAGPALILAAAIGRWREADAGLAGSLAGAPLRLARDGESGAIAPAEAELVILGAIPAEDTARTGPLLTPLGTQAGEADCPVFAGQAVLARPEPIFHVLQPGASGDLAAAFGLAAEALVGEHIRNIEGGIDVIDIRCPQEAGAQVVVLKLRARVGGQAKTALMGALSGPVNTIKFAIAVDEDVDPSDLRDVFWSVASRTHAEIDVGMIDGMRAHPHDHAAVRAGKGGARIATRWFIDSTMPPLTQPDRRETFARAIPKNLAATDLARFLPE